mmetsp:Transcript_19032/g.48660  ORF Transcript_19032/g.48660 Transcript_19032/m.48660 type:complete len:122 (+) Transcript_19032:3181-3546(+)
MTRPWAAYLTLFKSNIIRMRVYDGAAYRDYFEKGKSKVHACMQRTNICKPKVRRSRGAKLPPQTLSRRNGRLEAPFMYFSLASSSSVSFPLCDCCLHLFDDSHNGWTEACVCTSKPRIQKE